MGLIKFFAPNLLAMNMQAINAAYISGLEGIPWVGRIERDGDEVTIERTIDDSGRLSILWPSVEFGATVQTTASLRCCAEPYLLPLELARGALHRIRTRSSDWQRMGLKIPEAFQKALQIATDLFIDAIVLRQTNIELASQRSQDCIDTAMSAMRILCRAYVSQVTQFRIQQEGKLTTLMGVRLDDVETWQQDATTVLKSINTVAIPMGMHVVEADSNRLDYGFFERQLKWAQDEGLRVIAGPLLNLKADCIQNWMYLIDDFQTLQESANDFIEKTVLRFQGRVNIWNVFAGLNSPTSLNLSDEQILQLAVSSIQTVRRCDPRTPVVVSMDMPWAEYLGQHRDAISPLHFADTLIRAELGLSGIALDINLNYSPGGSLPRDLMDVSDLVDQWSNLGIPLIVMLTSPSSFDDENSRLASKSKSVIVSNWLKAGPSDSNISDKSETKGTTKRLGSENSPGTLATFALEVYQLLMSKQNIHGVFWNQLSDRCRTPLANAGLIDSNGKSRPLLDGLSQIRQRNGQ